MPLCLPICDANRHCWLLPRSNNSLGMAKWWHFHFTSPSSFISWNNCWCTITYSLVAGKYDQVHLKNIRINNPITAFQRIELIFHHLPKGNISFFSLFSITMNFYIFDVFPFTTFNILIVLQIFTFGHWESIDISSESFCFLTGSPASSSGRGSPVQFLLLTRSSSSLRGPAFFEWAVLFTTSTQGCMLLLAWSMFLGLFSSQS